MGDRRLLIPAFVTDRFGRGRVWPQVVRLILSVATLVIAVQVPLGATGSAKAATKSVDCADLAISFDAKSSYDLSCETDSTLIADMDGSVLIQPLEATAKDSSNFVDASYYNLMGRVIYTATDLRDNIKSFYDHIAITDWRPGRAVSTLTTAEFKADMRGLPSHCVAYQKLGHRDWGGYKKLMIGVACSQQDIDQSYAALKRLYLPE